MCARVGPQAGTGVQRPRVAPYWYIIMFVEWGQSDARVRTVAAWSFVCLLACFCCCCCLLISAVAILSGIKEHVHNL